MAKEKKKTEAAPKIDEATKAKIELYKKNMAPPQPGASGSDGKQTAMEKLKKFELKKSWQYLAYIVLVLPGVLFLLARLLRKHSIGVVFSRLFHTYSIYVSNPLPNLAPFNGTGVLGLAILAALVYWAVRRRAWVDLFLTLVLGGLNAYYFWMEWNYTVLRMLNLTGGVL